MLLQKVKAKKKKKIEVKNKNEAKGIYAAFLLSSEHAVFFSPVLCHISKSFCKGQRSGTNPIVSLPLILLKKIQPPSKCNKEGLLYP